MNSTSTLPAGSTIHVKGMPFELTHATVIAGQVNNFEIAGLQLDPEVKAMLRNKGFGEALEAAKQGHRISREGWNGKGMFVFLNKGSCDFNAVPGVPSAESITHIEGIKREHFEHGDNGTVTRLPNLNMKAATGSTVTGWLASQTDLLAEDWCIHELDA